MFTVKFSVAAAGNDNQTKNFQTKNLNWFSRIFQTQLFERGLNLTQS